eukprot:scaffold92136_cov20-Cyclotella_meneghiniana.AAC.1
MLDRGRCNRSSCLMYTTRSRISMVSTGDGGRLFVDGKVVRVDEIMEEGLIQPDVACSIVCMDRSECCDALEIEMQLW